MPASFIPPLSSFPQPALNLSAAKNLPSPQLAAIQSLRSNHHPKRGNTARELERDITRAANYDAGTIGYARLSAATADARELAHTTDAGSLAIKYAQGEEESRKEKLKTKWALEALVGSEKRLKLIARDLVEHYGRRTEAMDGKAMIVSMSRRICVELYNEIIALRPQWHDADDQRGANKIVMTGSADDPPEWQPHIRNKTLRGDLAKRFKDPQDPFRIVIVRDMWLTRTENRPGISPNPLRRRGYASRTAQPFARHFREVR